MRNEKQSLKPEVSYRKDGNGAVYMKILHVLFRKLNKSLYFLSFFETQTLIIIVVGDI